MCAWSRLANCIFATEGGYEVRENYSCGGQIIFQLLCVNVCQKAYLE